MSIDDASLKSDADTLYPSRRMQVVMPDGTEKSGVISSFLGEGCMANVYEIWNEQFPGLNPCHTYDTFFPSTHLLIKKIICFSVCLLIQRLIYLSVNRGRDEKD